MKIIEDLAKKTCKEEASITTHFPPPLSPIAALDVSRDLFAAVIWLASHSGLEPPLVILIPRGLSNQCGGSCR